MDRFFLCFGLIKSGDGGDGGGGYEIELSLRAGSRLGFMREMRDASGEAARAWGEEGGAGRRESLLLLL